MLPAIQTHARVAFGHLDAEACEDAVEEVIANCLVAFVRLVERGKTEVAYPSVLARFAVAQFRDGRRVGNRRNGHDVLSPYARKRNGIVVERLEGAQKDGSEWAEALAGDRRTPVLEQVAFRCDFPDWLSSLPRRNRRIAEALALGHSTKAVARRFGVSPGRISQLRGELSKSWLEFHGETPAEGANP
jgi:hypothetical protein